MQKILSLTCLVASLLITSHALAETKLSDGFSDDELIDIFTNEGYGAVTKLQDSYLRIKVDGLSYVLINHSDGDLQAYYGISTSGITYERINEWNRTKRLSRAYLDSDNDPILEADLLANGGLTTENVTEFFRIFMLSVDSFRSFIREQDA